MEQQELTKDITTLQARMNRMELLMRQVLNMLTSDATNAHRIQIQNMLQELQRDPESIPQERPEIKAIRAALLSGDRMKAAKLYRGVYGVSLNEALAALDTM